MNNEKQGVANSVANSGLQHLLQLTLLNCTADLSEMLHDVKVDYRLEAELHHDRPELTTVTITNADPLLPLINPPTEHSTSD